MNLATEFCIQVPLRLFGKVIGIPREYGTIHDPIGNQDL